MKYQTEVQIDRGISKVRSGIPRYILSEEASIQLITKKGRRFGLQIRMLKLFFLYFLLDITIFIDKIKEEVKWRGRP